MTQQPQLDPKPNIRERLTRLRQRFFSSRNSILFIMGTLGVIHETLFQHAERPTLLILFAAMMGLPAFLAPQTPGSLGIAPAPPPPVEATETTKTETEGHEKPPTT